ncbi:putative RNA-binding [Hyphodiscus hymeniophilus]|uniref:RNA-binding n=1 Tax=Hyphodiscus hymeniophilus TaxID=353542 RepID=A0A9P6VJT3_9HELO|nr:putative RNA-binding [Hyphodiscus hymeniophilus]
MLFSEEDAPHLKAFIVKRLENTSDADADVLADYVLALLRHDGDVNTVRALCEAEIPDFLKEDSSIFVQDVFHAIHYKSYLPGAPPPPRRKSPQAFAPPTGPSAPSYGNIGMPGAPVGPQNGSRKRSYNERGDGDGQDRGGFYGDPNGRAFKQMRRGGVGGNTGRGNFDNFNGRGGFQGRPSSIGAPAQGFPILPGMPSPPPGMPPLDPNNPMATILAMQAMGFPVPSMPEFSQASSPSGRPPSQGSRAKRERCRDYDQKGFCARGNTCMFEHGQDSIYVPPGRNGEEYDPSDASLMTGVRGAAVVPGLDTGNGYSGPYNAPETRGRGRGGMRGGRGGQSNTPNRRGGRAEFSSDRPNYDKTRMTIVVEQIPEEKFSEDEVRGFFAEFGNIVEVTMRPYKRLAIVKYDDYEGAKAAYNSPKVIFDNRFVKVYWYVDQDSLPQPPSVSGSRPANGANGANGGPSAQTATRPEPEPQIDIEEFTRKQQEVQKAHEEKMKKKLEMDVAKKELEKRQEELLKNQAEEKRKLLERIAAKSGKTGTPIAGSEGGTPAPTEKSNPQTEALRAQLAALEAEAKSLGIDPETPEDSWSSRGRGRGRGGYRGRGSFAPRGFRGGYRGRGAPYAARGGGTYNLDNRPKTIGLSGVDFTNAAKDESLRQYLLGIGEFTDIKTTRERTAITFKDRFTAEKFMYGIPGGEIPSIGKVDISWIQTPLPPVNPVVLKTSKDEDTMMDEGDAMAHNSSPARGGQGHEQQEHIDYDVADENDWGVQ